MRLNTIRPCTKQIAFSTTSLVSSPYDGPSMSVIL